MQINGVELIFDVGSNSFIERYDNAFLTFKENMTSLPEGSKEFFNKLAPELRLFIDTVWGDGVYDSLKLNPDRNDVHLDLLYDIADEAGRVQTEFSDRYQKRMAKYTPNRAQRRAKKK